MEFCERFAYYGATLVFIPYMVIMLHMSDSDTDAVQNAFMFWAYFCALIGGYLGDAVLGQCKTILLFAVVYIIGLTILTLSAMPFSYSAFPEGPSPTLAYGGLFLALIIIGVATGIAALEDITVKPSANCLNFRWDQEQCIYDGVRPA